MIVYKCLQIIIYKWLAQHQNQNKGCLKRVAEVRPQRRTKRKIELSSAIYVWILPKMRSYQCAVISSAGLACISG